MRIFIPVYMAIDILDSENKEILEYIRNNIKDYSLKIYRYHNPKLFPGEYYEGVTLNEEDATILKLKFNLE